MRCCADREHEQPAVARLHVIEVGEDDEVVAEDPAVGNLIACGAGAAILPSAV